MTEDFFYALTVGWAILFIFWAIIITFIWIRKPPKSKLTSKTIYYSVFFFIAILLTIFFLNGRFVYS